MKFLDRPFGRLDDRFSDHVGGRLDRRLGGRLLWLLLGLAALGGAACGGGTSPSDGAATDGCAAHSQSHCGEGGAAGDGGPNGGSDGSTDGGAGLLGPCLVNEDCTSRLCHYYLGKGASFCTKPCTSDGDCPAPSPGCNQMGVCRIQ